MLNGIAVARSLRRKCPQLKAALQPLYERKTVQRDEAREESQPLEKLGFDFERLTVESSHTFSNGKIKTASKNNEGDVESIGLVGNGLFRASQSARGGNFNLTASVLETDLVKIIGKNGNAELLGQFQLAVYPDFSEWRLADRESDADVLGDVSSIFARLDE